MKRVGIVGCGNIAGTHVWALQQIKDVEIIAFSDVIIEKADCLARKSSFGNANIYCNLTDMLKKEKPDVLHICTPHYLHVPMIIEALSMGISVFSEKPPAISMEQFNEIDSYIKKNDSKLGFCFQNRYNHSIKIIDERIALGNFGKIIGSRAFVTWRRDEEYYQSEWKGKIATEGGGVLMNQSIHTLDLMLRYLGKPETIKASMANHHLSCEIEIEDTLEAWMTFQGGKRGCFYATNSYIVDAPVIIELQFENGTISLMGNSLLIKETGKQQEYIVIEEQEGVGKNYWGTGHLSCIKDFYQCLESNKRFQNDYEGVRNTMETMMKIYEFRN